MAINIFEILGIISGYKQRYDTLKAEYDIKFGTPPDLAITEATGGWVRGQLQQYFPAMTYIPLDNVYQLTDQNSFLNVVVWDWIDKKEYQREKFDCDKFSICFAAHCYEYIGIDQVGIIIDWSSAHAYNLVLFPTGKPMLFEPQSDSLFAISERDVQLYGLQNGVILL